MASDLHYGPRHNGTIRRSGGCWTCRLRRKKCDENYPVCSSCSSLLITCHNDTEKPEWMDGGKRQEEMAEQSKREVKEKAYLRRGGAFQIAEDHAPHTEAPISDGIMLPRSTHDNGMQPCPEVSIARPQRGADCTITGKGFHGGIEFGRSDTVLLMFYLEHLLPFLFPFYRPSPLQGGRSWILEMMISSPVVRQVTLCQSAYFFSLAREGVDRYAGWDTILTQTQAAFGVLRQALQVIDGSGITEHLHGAVRIMASIVQIQRFETAILSFNNCKAHLDAALIIFKQLLDSCDPFEPAEPSSRFKIVESRLGPPSCVSPTQCDKIPSAEQSAFCFSSALLVLDDIIASTVLQEPPRLIEYHRSLLNSTDGINPAINLEAAVGCRNEVLLQIGETAALDAWKQQCKSKGSLDAMELVRRATIIKDSLISYLAHIEKDSEISSDADNSLLNALMADYFQQSAKASSQSTFVTRIWAHAALVYLSVVVSGWQPANSDVCYHVDCVIDLLTYEIKPPELLRTMAWPFCVIGCLVEPAQEACFRKMVETLQPANAFGTIRKALEIMENVWCNRYTEGVANRDFATCFRSHGDFILLV